MPDDQALVGQALEFKPSGANFNPPIRITLGYDIADLPDGFTSGDLDLAFFDSGGGQWITLGGTAEPATRSVTAAAPHFTSFGVLTKPGPSVNWGLSAGILALELGLGLAAFALIRRRRRLLAAAVESPSQELFVPASPAEPGVAVAGALPSPTVHHDLESPTVPMRKVEQEETQH